MNVCDRRTAYFASHPEHATRNGVGPLPLPHVFGSRMRRQVDGEWTEWSHPRCSWCGAFQ